MFAFADFATAPDQSIQQLLINQKKAQFAVHHKAVDGTASAAQTVQASGTPAMDAVTANVCVIFGPPKCGKTSLLFHAAYEHAKAGGHPLLILTVKAPPPLPADSISAEIKLQESKPHLPRLPYHARDDVMRRIRIKSITNEAELRVLMASLPFLTAPVMVSTAGAATAAAGGGGGGGGGVASSGSSAIGAAPIDLVLIDDFSGVHSYQPYQLTSDDQPNRSNYSASGGGAAGGTPTRKPQWTRDAYHLNPSGETEVLCKSLGILYSSIEYLTKIKRECRVVLTDSHNPFDAVHQRVVSAVFDRFVSQSFVISPSAPKSRAFKMVVRSTPSTVTTANPSTALLKQLPLELPSLALPAIATPDQATAAVQSYFTAISTAQTTQIVYAMSDTSLDVISTDAPPPLPPSTATLIRSGAAVGGAATATGAQTATATAEINMKRNAGMEVDDSLIDL